MQWGEAGEQPGDGHYLREIAGFLAERRRVQRPAVLWPQSEPPGLRGDFDAHLSLLRRELAVLLEQVVAAGPPGPGTATTTGEGTAGKGTTGERSTGEGTLLLQGAGAVGIALRLPHRPGQDRRIRLRTGELLYLPPDAQYTVTGTADARYGVLSVPSQR
ncbi:hypothetical protein [Streptomyces sp. NRRL WC-3742]|uniref:hypothetical protein n=1 Tax=Streptomyces sp. NRRL WC-3742 TaxID=1463934 RepID=UPI0004CBE323|nr:hypothetical protein [Streptomyces sp. NRRL WC-3742]